MKISKVVASAILLAASCGVARAQTSVQFLEYSQAWGTVVADFNNDGHDDIFVVGHDLEDRIWYWTPTGYIPAPNAFPWVDRHDCDVADVNHDGLLDMYCALGAHRGTGLKVNELWIQQPGGQFKLSSGVGVDDPSGSSRYEKFFDLDHDGWPDIYNSNEGKPRADGLPDINHVYRNNHDGSFTEVQTVATGPLGWACVTKGDIDGDGWDDVLVCKTRSNGRMFINNHANDFTLLDSPAIGIWRDAKLVDVNGDGRDDLLVAGYDNVFRIFLNTGTAPYFVSAVYTDTLPSFPTSVAVGDFNHDGNKDVYVVVVDHACESKGLQETEPDVVYWGNSNGSWTKETLKQNFAGCGHLADVVDGDKILLENGDFSLPGPNFVLSWRH